MSEDSRDKSMNIEAWVYGCGILSVIFAGAGALLLTRSWKSKQPIVGVPDAIPEAPIEPEIIVPSVTIICALSTGEEWKLRHEFGQDELARTYAAKLFTGGRREDLPRNWPDGKWTIGEDEEPTPIDSAINPDRESPFPDGHKGS